MGNARTFLITWLLARTRGVKIIFRMEDLDHPRVKPETKQEAIDDLRWLGIDWDEGFTNDDDIKRYTQSNRTEIYKQAIDKLIKKKLIYPCICTRKEIENIRSAPHEGDYSPKYPGTCRDKFLSFEDAEKAIIEDRLPAWRFRCPNEETVFCDGFQGKQIGNPAKSNGDFIIARGKYGAGYQLAVVVDDAEMNVTEVIRGDDLLPCTHWQILLYKALDIEKKIPKYFHLPLLVGPDGKRLAKRHGDTRISIYRKRGYSPNKLIGLLAYYSGFADFGEELSINELQKRFNINKIPKHKITVKSKDENILK